MAAPAGSIDGGNELFGVATCGDADWVAASSIAGISFGSFTAAVFCVGVEPGIGVLVTVKAAAGCFDLPDEPGTIVTDA